MVDDGTKDWGCFEISSVELAWVQKLDDIIWSRAKSQLTSSDTSCHTWTWFQGGLTPDEAFHEWVELHYL